MWECLLLSEMSLESNMIVQFLGCNTVDSSTTDRLYPLESFNSLIVVLINAVFLMIRYLLTELHEIGTLREVLNNSSIFLSWSLRLKILTDIAEAVEFLHLKDIVHLDLTSRNCLVSSLELEDEIVNAVVFDFGNSRDYKEERLPTRTLTTPTHTAPEQISMSLYNEKADVYSFSMIMFEVASRAEVYTECEAQSVRSLLEQVSLGKRPNLNANCIVPQEYVDLMKQCWSTAPSQRPSFSVIASSLRAMTRRRMFS